MSPTTKLRPVGDKGKGAAPVGQHIRRKNGEKFLDYTLVGVAILLFQFDLLRLGQLVSMFK